MKNERYISKALAEVRRRHSAAEAAAAERNDRAETEIPELARLRSELAMTSIELSRLILSRPADLQARIEELRQTNLNGQQLISQLLVSNGYGADYLDVKYFCDKCNDTGIIGNNYCDCVNELATKYAVEELNRKSQVTLSSFDSFKLSYYPNDVKDKGGKTPRERMGDILAFCTAYARSFSLNSPNLLMIGKTGLGKTHLSLSIAETVVSCGFTVAYDSVVNYLRQIDEERFGRTSGDTMAVLLDTDLLILDDIGSEYKSKNFDSYLYNIINTRINQSKPTIISTNLSTQELQEQYNERIISRIISEYEWLSFVGNDIRQIKRREKMMNS